MTDAESQRTARFDELFRACVADIAAYCRWRTRSAADADDALAEVFLVAWRRLDDVPASAREARVWLYATARRVTANQHRAARRQMGLVDRIVQSRNREIPVPAITDGPDAQRVRAALAQLSARDREALLLAEWEQLTSAQAARVMGCSEGSARGRLHRARKRFRAAFERLHPHAANALHTPAPLARPALAQPADSSGRIDHA